MMAADSMQNLNTSIVLQASGAEFGSAEPGLLLGSGIEELRQFIDAPTVQESANGPVLLSMRNQLTLTITPSILAFHDVSGEAPARDDFPGRVAQVARHIGNQSQLTYSKLGLVFEFEAKLADDELLSETILRRFIREDALEGTGYAAIGASVRLWYVARDRIHGLRVEPKGDQKESREYYAHVDVETTLRDELPSAEWLSQFLCEEYGDFLRVVDEILQPVKRS